MKYLPLIGKSLIILLITVPALLISAAFLMQDKVSDIILASLNRNLSTKLETGSMKLSFLRKFPRASVELRNAVVHSSPGFRKTDFSGQNTDTLIFARSIFVEFRPAGVLTGNYRIEEIGAKSGFINFLIDASGKVNYKISSGENKGGNEFKMDLRKINLHEMNASYINLSNKFRISGVINNGRLKSRIAGSNVDFTAVTEMQIDSFSIFKTTITRPLQTSLELELQSTGEGIRFSKSSLKIDNYDFSIEGTISSEDVYDLDIKGNNVDLSKIGRWLPEKYAATASDYDPAGVLEITCKVSGPVTRTTSPHIEINWQLDDGKIRYRGSNLAMKNISFKGNFSNGSGNRSSTSSVSVRDIKLKLGSSDYAGAIKISDFDRPGTEITLSGKVLPAEIKSFFGLKDLTVASGSVDADLRCSTFFWPKDSMRLDNIIDLRPRGTLLFNSFALGWGNDGMLFKNVNGRLDMTETYKSSDFSFEYGGQNIRVNGEFRNLPEWLAGRPVTLTASGDVYFDKLIPEVFTRKTSDAQPSATTGGFEFPADVLLDFNFRSDNFSYKTFSSTDIRGTLSYKPRLLTFKTLEMKSLSGSVKGNGFIVQNANKTIMARGDFDVQSIDVNTAFKTFNNFGQKFIVAENLSGDLSGSISLLLPMDSKFKPRINSITADGRYVLVNGGLIDFEPVKQLSNFIELSELENIHFQKLENDFFIRNNVLFIPQMDVKSSAADLTVNGQHDFSNNYEYHVKILLSQILSKKRRGNRPKVNTEFGAVQDDGLGRTSLLLKVWSRGEDLKVGYDLKAVSQEVKTNIKAEKQNLKTILNEEYGWYKDEPKVQQQPAEKKSRFSITWSETDSIPAEEKSTESDQPGLKSLFRRK